MVLINTQTHISHNYWKHASVRLNQSVKAFISFMKTILTICKDTRKGSPHKWGVNTCKPSVRSIIALQKPDCDSLLIFYVSNVLNSDAQISLELGDNGAFPHERNLKTAGNGVRFPWLNAICSKGYSALAIIFYVLWLLYGSSYCLLKATSWCTSEQSDSLYSWYRQHESCDQKFWADGQYPGKSRK